MNYFVMSDIHGCYDEMIEALKHWNKDEEHLVVIGDLIDRGPDSLKVVRYLMKLQEENENVTITMGNHEEMFLNLIYTVKDGLFAHYYNEIHTETIMSFYENKKDYQRASRNQRGKHILYNYRKELEWMEDLPYYFETENIIFVHAGINLRIDNWRSNIDNVLWVRNEFIYSQVVAPKRVFFGHTPTQFIHERETAEENKNDIWISKQQDKVGIDGGVCFGGQLNTLRVNEKGEILEVIKVKAQ